MRLKSSFEIVEVGDECFLIPVGDEAAQFRGMVAVNEETVFLLRHMSNDVGIEEVVEILTKEYEVNASVALRDVQSVVGKLTEMGVLDT